MVARLPFPTFFPNTLSSLCLSCVSLTLPALPNTHWIKASCFVLSHATSPVPRVVLEELALDGVNIYGNGRCATAPTVSNMSSLPVLAEGWHPANSSP